MASHMTDSHRRFLQVLMSNGIIDAVEARRLHRFFCEQHKVYYAHDKLDDFVGVINTFLRPLFMEIRKGRSEDHGKMFYALVNLAITEATKVASDYAENELELFKKTMDLIVESESGYASSTSILNLSDKLQSKKMKKKEAEQVLQMFVQDKWLSEYDSISKKLQTAAQKASFLSQKPCLSAASFQDMVNTLYILAASWNWISIYVRHIRMSKSATSATVLPFRASPVIPVELKCIYLVLQSISNLSLSHTVLIVMKCGLMRLEI
ncbi:non-structural maintenance of chromosomes element 1 homolog isoform X1 [Phascolarctos cinereus]